MQDRFKIMVFDAGILGTTVLEELAKNKQFSIVVVDDKKVTFHDITSTTYPKKHFGKLRTEVLKEKFGSEIDCLNSIKNLNGKELSNADILISTSDEFDLDVNNCLNEIAFKNNKKLLTARIIENNLAEIGPLFIPGKTACFKCYETRIRSNLENAENYFKIKLFLGNTEKLFNLTALRKNISSLINLEISRIAYGQEPRIFDKIITLNLENNSMKEETLFRIPNCSVCDSK